MADQGLASLNRDAWDSRAKYYDIHPWQQKISSQIASVIRDNIAWISPTLTEEGKERKLLDYACGTGNMTLALKPYITSAVGMDISLQMLEVYTERMTSFGINARTVLGDLASGIDTAVQVKCDTDFDIAAVAIGFHHFEDPQSCAKRLVDRLGSGGVLVVVDWIHDRHHKHGHDRQHNHHGGHDHGEGKKEEGREHEAEEWKQIKQTMKHHGFDEEGLKDMFQAAGLVDFDFLRIEEVFVLEMNGKRVEKAGFVAKGRKV